MSHVSQQTIIKLSPQNNGYNSFA